MNYFGEDGPEAIPNKVKDDQVKMDEAKSRYLQHFMVDFVEYNIRKVASQNLQFCANRCEMFSNIWDEDLSLKQTKA